MKKVNTKIGNRIKDAREAKKVSVKDLTDKTGLQEDYLKELEKNDETPNMAELIKISKALGLRPGTFTDGEEDLAPVVCTPSMIRGNNAKDKDGGRNYLHFYSLNKNKKNRQMDAYMVDLEPFSGKMTYSTHEGEEFIYVVEGSVRFVYGKQTYTLKEGSTVYYDSIVPHFTGSAYKTKPARILCVSYFPA